MCHFDGVCVGETKNITMSSTEYDCICQCSMYYSRSGPDCTEFTFETYVNSIAIFITLIYIIKLFIQCFMILYLFISHGCFRWTKISHILGINSVVVILCFLIIPALYLINFLGPPNPDANTNSNYVTGFSLVLFANGYFIILFTWLQMVQSFKVLSKLRKQMKPVRFIIIGVYVILLVGYFMSILLGMQAYFFTFITNPILIITLILMRTLGKQLITILSSSSKCKVTVTTYTPLQTRLSKVEVSVTSVSQSTTINKVASVSNPTTQNQNQESLRFTVVWIHYVRNVSTGYGMGIFLTTCINLWMSMAYPRYQSVVVCFNFLIPAHLTMICFFYFVSGSRSKLMKIMATQPRWVHYCVPHVSRYPRCWSWRWGVSET